MRIFGVILAGGAGRRLGGTDKGLLLLGGTSLATRVRDRLEPQVERLAISANGDPARLAFLGLPILVDTEPLGPLAGLLAGLDWAAARGATALVGVPVDTPFLPGDLVPQLLLAAGDEAAIACSDRRLHPTVGIWPVGLRHALRMHLASGGRSMRGFAEVASARHAAFNDPDAFINLNTPADVARAEGLLA